MARVYMTRDADESTRQVPEVERPFSIDNDVIAATMAGGDARHSLLVRPAPSPAASAAPVAGHGAVQHMH